MVGNNGQKGGWWWWRYRRDHIYVTSYTLCCVIWSVSSRDQMTHSLSNPDKYPNWALYKTAQPCLWNLKKVYKHKCGQL